MKFLAIVLALATPPIVYVQTLGAHRRAGQAKADAELRDLTARVETSHEAQRKLAEFHDEAARLGAELTKLRTILPPSIGIDDVRKSLDASAASHGVTVVRFDTARKPSATRQSVDVEVVGSAEATAEFFRELENLPRVFDVGYVTVRRDPAGWRTRFVMTSYALPD